MPDVTWFELAPPPALKLADVTALVRVLAGRPHVGLRRLQAPVVFEMWLYPDDVRWLVGCDESLAARLPSELAAQVGGLGVVPVKRPSRPLPVTGRELRLSTAGASLRQDTAAAVTAGVLAAQKQLHASEAVVVQWVIGPSQRMSRQPVEWTPLEYLGFVKAPQPDTGQRAAFRQKLDEPLFGARGRLGAAAADLRRAAAVMSPVAAALGLSSTDRVRVTAGLQTRRIAEQLHAALGRRRTWSSIANARELATLLAFPVEGVPVPGERPGLTVPPDGVVVVRKRTQLILGTSPHPRRRGQLVGIPSESTSKHTLVTGPSGSGKSVLLAHWAAAWLSVRRSLILIEPKGDLVRDVLSVVSPGRRDDVVLLQPSNDDTRPVTGFNPLAGDAADAERRADAVLHQFVSVFGGAIGPRSADTLWHAVLAIAKLDDGSLPDVAPFLTDAGFRRRVLAQVADPLVLGPWAAGFDGLTEPEQMRVVGPVLNKLRAFNRSSLRRMLGQSASAFSLEDAFRTPKIVLVAANAGLNGQEASRLLGGLLLSQCWGVIQRQAAVPMAKRRPVMVMVDELSDFTAGLDVAELLQKARSANVSFVAAHQHLGQFSRELRAAMAANARNRVTFRPSIDDAKALGELFGVPSETLLGLDGFRAVASVLVGNRPSSAFEIQTLPPPTPVSDPETVALASLNRYGRLPTEVDAALLARWQGTATASPVGRKKRGGAA